MRFSNIFRSGLHKLRRNAQGAAFIEFALSLPFMMLLFGGSIDVTRMVLLHQKVDKAVFTVGDVATQLEIESGVCNTIQKWQNSVVKDMVKPFDWDEASFNFIMSSVIGARPDSNPNKPVQDLMEWSYNNSAESRLGIFTTPYETTATLPPSIQGLEQNERVIVTEMRYRFVPMLPLLSHLEEANFYKASYFRSRITTGTTSKRSGPLSQLGAC